MSAIHVGMKLSAIWFPSSALHSDPETMCHAISSGAKSITVVEVAGDNAMVPWAEVVYEGQGGVEHRTFVNLAYVEEINVLTEEP